MKPKLLRKYSAPKNRYPHDCLDLNMADPLCPNTYDLDLETSLITFHLLFHKNITYFFWEDHICIFKALSLHIKGLHQEILQWKDKNTLKMTHCAPTPYSSRLSFFREACIWRSNILLNLIWFIISIISCITDRIQ